MGIFNFSWFHFYYKLFIIFVVRRNLVRLVLALFFFFKNSVNWRTEWDFN